MGDNRGRFDPLVRFVRNPPWILIVLVILRITEKPTFKVFLCCAPVLFLGFLFAYTNDKKEEE